jgi:peptide/nickel transport system substrate-binding protein
MRRALLLAAALLAAAPAAAQPLRVSLNTELQVLDPIVTSINATRVFAYMVFDTLVGIDNSGKFRPQMLEGWEVSDDRLTWRFRLRDGLEFSDGTPVTAEDCVASIRRWAKREALGTLMLRSAEALEVVDARSFTLKLNRPFAFVVEALGKPGHTIPVMMPARLANMPADKAVPEIVGSGPFLFRRAEWRPGGSPADRPHPTQAGRGFVRKRHSRAERHRGPATPPGPAADRPPRRRRAAPRPAGRPGGSRRAGRRRGA